MMFGGLIFLDRRMSKNVEEAAFITPFMKEGEIDKSLAVLSNSLTIESKIRLL